MPFLVVFQPRARSDIAATIAWLARNSKAAAARWRTGLLRIVENLETNPHRYAEAEEAVDLGVDLRQLLYGRRRNVYRILFTIDGQTVNIHRVRHAARDRLAPDDI
jgi:plasmid stabilization system protein ParE